ncbi:MAG: sigma-70 family RNA polymerase sigma factor [Pseudomonadota bacterium]
MPPSEPAVFDQAEALYESHHSWLINWLRRRTGCQHAASDLTQDVFVRLLGRNSIPIVREPRAFLARIARGLLIDQRRRENIHQCWLESLAHNSPQYAPSTEEQEIIIDTLVRIDALLGGLKPRCREAFLLSRLEGLSYPAIAERLGVSLSTIEKDIAQALRHCFLALQD